MVARYAGAQARWYSVIFDFVVEFYSPRRVRHIRQRVTNIGGHVADDWATTFVLLMLALSLLAQAPPGLHTPRSDDFCTGRSKTTFRINLVLMGMNFVGGMLRCFSLLGLANFFGLLQDDARRVTEGMPSLFQSPAAREQCIAYRSSIIANFSNAGKLCLRPVLPGVLLSHACFMYQCVNPYQGRTILIAMCSLVSCMHVGLVLAVDVAALSWRLP